MERAAGDTEALGQLLSCVLEIRFTDDRVPPIDALGLVADEFHGRGAADAGALEVSYRGPAKVVRDLAGKPDLLAGREPATTQVLDGLPASVEHSRADGASLLLQGLSQGPLRLQDLTEVWDERELARLVLLSPALRRSQPWTKSISAQVRVRISDFSRQPVR